MCTKIKVARELLCISTRVLQVSTPDTTASVVSFENRVGRIKCSSQSSVGSKHLNGWLYCNWRKGQSPNLCLLSLSICWKCMYTYKRADCENSKHFLLHFTISTSHVREREREWGMEGRGGSMNRRDSLPFLCCWVFPFYLWHLNKASAPKSWSVINALIKINVVIETN